MRKSPTPLVSERESVWSSWKEQLHDLSATVWRLMAGAAVGKRITLWKAPYATVTRRHVGYRNWTPIRAVTLACISQPWRRRGAFRMLSLVDVSGRRRHPQMLGSVKLTVADTLTGAILGTSRAMENWQLKMDKRKYSKSQKTRDDSSLQPRSSSWGLRALKGDFLKSKSDFRAKSEIWN